MRRKIHQLLRSKFTWIALGVVVLFGMGFVVISNLMIIRSTRDQIHHTTLTVPYNDVGLVLGTSEYIKGGRPNLFFRYRMDAAASLYHSGKIRHIIVSGDNHVRYYDEPTAMRNALIERGVPKDAITLDYAGFRTLDSVVRCFKIFGQQRFTIISQRFHLQRALFIARYYGLDASGFAAPDPGYNTSKTSYREYLAKCKAVLDLYIIHKQPKFLGPREPIML